MKKMNTGVLLDSLREDTRQIIYTAEQLRKKSPELLQHMPSAGGWNIAQVLQHLNIYCRYYLETIEQSIHRAPVANSEYFTPGWLGNYFTAVMQPGADGIIKKKMKAPANAKPSSQANGMEELCRFIRYQYRLLNLLQIAENTNLEKRIPTSLSRFIRLKTGDCFRFVIAHQQRHFVQIKNILNNTAHNISLSGYPSIVPANTTTH